MTQLDHSDDVLAGLLRTRAASIPLAAGSPSAARRRAAQRTNRTRLSIGAGAVAVLGGGAVAARALDDSSPGRVTAGSEPSSTVPVTSTTTSGPAMATPLRLGIAGEQVRDLEQQLRALGFDPGPVDGVFDETTQQAVWAAEGLILQRPPEQQTGVVDRHLTEPLRGNPVIRPRRTMPGTHVEIYLDLQVAVVFTDDAAVLVTHISSGQLDPDGTPTTFCDEITIDTDELGNPLPEPEVRGVCSESKTPGGVFEFTRRYVGERVGPLGGMFNPVYFNYGIAIHGSQNVPVFPSSHGGVRIPMHVAEYFPSLVSDGDPVFVWDGLKEPEDQTKEDMLPSFLSPDTTE